VPFGLKKRPEVDLSDFEDDREKLASFLNSKLNVNVTFSQNKLTTDSKEITTSELAHGVTKFIYHQHLNQQYWVSLNGNTVKINRFKNVKKPEKPRKHGTSPTFAHGF
jgi:hypothetical protein